MKILLADDQKEVRDALKIILEQEEELEVVAEAAEPDSLIARTAESKPELILLDWEFGYVKVADIVPQLHSIKPDMKIIALSCHPEACCAALAAGADGFVSKGDHPETLLQAIKDIGSCLS